MRTISFVGYSVLLMFSIPGINSAQWVQTSIPNGGLVNCLAVSGRNLFAGTWSGGGVFCTTDGGTSWTTTSTGLPGSPVFSLAVKGANLVAGTNGSGVYFSTNSGTSWMASNTILPMYRAAVYAFAYSDSILFAAIDGAYEGGVYLSTNNGANWSKTSLTERSTVALAMNGTTLFAGVYDNFVYRSTDNGATWTWIAFKNGLYYDGVWTLAATGSTIFAGTDSKLIFRSIDNGESWASAGLDSFYAINSFAISGTNVFAATSSGVYLSIDNGMHWSPAGLTDSIVHALTCDDATLYAGTGSSVWKRPLSEMVADVENNRNQVPDEFALDQNYPNPFNPSTTIRYALPHRSHVTLAVYNTLGQLVAKLINGDIDAGSHEVTFDASGLSSGVYFYRIQAGDFIQSKKLVLLK